MTSITRRLTQAGTFLFLSFLVLFTAPLRAEDAEKPLGLDMVKPWTGDFDAMEKRRIVRILVPYSKTIYFIDKGEEDGLKGSNAYVASLSDQQKADIAAYLNFDMLGSPNGERYVYRLSTPPGSTRLEHAFLAWFRARGLATRPTDIVGDRSDQAAFADAGIPVSGLFSGAEETKTEAEWRDFGGIVGVLTDPNYHTPNDRFSNVNQKLFGELAHAGAFVVTRLALDPRLLPHR